MANKELRIIAVMLFAFFLVGTATSLSFAHRPSPNYSLLNYSPAYSDTIPLKINYEMLEMFEIYKGKDNLSDSIRYQLLHNQAIRTTDLWTRTYLLYLLSLMEKSGISLDVAKEPIIQKEVSVTETKPQRISEEPKPTRTVAGQTESTKPGRTPAQHFREPDIMGTTKPATSGVVSYHVQIAASRVALSPLVLREIYQGEEEIFNYQEDGWEKYYIGNFDSFRKAMSLLRQISVSGAFPIAFVMGTKTSILKAQEAERSQASGIIRSFSHIPEPIYRIQIAASRKPLSAIQLSKIYPRPDEIGVILEDNWYKYSLDGGQTLDETLQKLRQLQIPGAFVIRYQKGTKIPLK